MSHFPQDFPARISVSFHNGATTKAVSFPVKQNKTKSLQLLLDLGQDPDDMVDEEDCVTSLMWAAAQGHHECVQILATAKADINKSGRNGITAYFMACMSGDQKCMHIQSKAKSLQLLLDIGQDPDDMVDEEDCVTSLMWAAAQGHHECVQILATAKADINKSGRNGITAYFMACMSGDQKCMHIQSKAKSLQLLLDIGQDPDDMVDEEDCVTSLMWAAAQGHHECVQILATAKADINKSGRNGITAYFMACMSGDQKCMHIQSKAKSLQLLLDIGQDPDDMVDEEDCVTSLMWAAAQGHHECVQILATAKADINKSGRNGITAYFMACMSGDQKCMHIQSKAKSLQLLLDLGQDPDDMVDEEDCPTSLMWAAAQGHHECVQILATAKADIN